MLGGQAGIGCVRDLVQGRPPRLIHATDSSTVKPRSFRSASSDCHTASRLYSLTRRPTSPQHLLAAMLRQRARLAGEVGKGEVRCLGAMAAPWTGRRRYGADIEVSPAASSTTRMPMRRQNARRWRIAADVVGSAGRRHGDAISPRASPSASATSPSPSRFLRADRQIPRRSRARSTSMLDWRVDHQADAD